VRRVARWEGSIQVMVGGKNDQAKIKIKGEHTKKLTGVQCGLT
jgi:hypothetical protein